MAMLARLASPLVWVASPFKKFGEAVADILVSDPSAPVDLAVPASPKSPRSPSPAVRKRAGKRASTKQPSPAIEKRSAVKVKLEPTRDLPRRRQKAKSGFYSETNLQSLACATQPTTPPAQHSTAQLPDTRTPALARTREHLLGACAGGAASAARPIPLFWTNDHHGAWETLLTSREKPQTEGRCRSRSRWAISYPATMGYIWHQEASACK